MQDCIFILFTGQDSHDIDIAATEAGAADFILKSEITSARLERSVRFALSMNAQKQQLLDMTRALEAANDAALKTANELELTQGNLRTALSQANASEMQKRLVLDALPIAVAYIDANERYVLVNQLACDMYRKEERDIVGLSVSELHGEEFAAVVETLESVLQDETATVENQIRYPDNITRDVKIYAAPDVCPDGTILGWYTMTEDISERRKLDNLKKEFITTVSHELRTPLTSLFGSIRLLQQPMQGKSSDGSLHLVDIAFRNCERLMDLVNDLLDMEKIETGEIKYDLAPLAIRNIVQDGIELNAGYGQRFNISFEIDGDIPELTVAGNHQALLQVLANFLSNASKYSPEGGRVAVAAAQAGQFAEISVRDWGCGIPDKYHDIIFDKFVKIDTLNSSQIPGTGLGLSICRKIVDEHNGQIGFHSKSGAGSTFYFRIPLSDASGQSEIPLEPPQTAAGSRG
jgi:PAS domain S-box-containing protein